MKLFREILLVFGIYYLGEFLSHFLHLPLPGNLLGMLILLLLLCFRVVRLEQIEMITAFLLDHLPFFFIPAGVGLIAVFPQIQNSLLWIILICVITMIITLGTTGSVIQWTMRKKKVRHE